MSRDQRILYPNPPLAGRPPFATDEPESIYETDPSVQARYRLLPPQSSNSQTSAFNTNDTYLDSPSYRDERNPFTDPTHTVENNGMSNQGTSIPLAAPRPGYAAPVAVLNLAHPSPTATPDGRMPPDMSQMHTPIPIGVPNTPHPLQAPLTPISPVFARPSGSPSPSDVTFASRKPIIRGGKEETILPKRGEKGDDFWRRFSTVVKEEKKTHYKSSNWLKKTQNGSSRLYRWVWVIAFFLIACIAGACFLGWYVSHNLPDNSDPITVGGKENEQPGPSSTESSVVAGGIATSSSRHVTPTLTLNDKREPTPFPSPGGVLEYQAYRTYHRQQRRSNLRRSHTY